MYAKITSTCFFEKFRLPLNRCQIIRTTIEKERGHMSTNICKKTSLKHISAIAIVVTCHLRRRRNTITLKGFVSQRKGLPPARPLSLWRIDRGSSPCSLKPKSTLCHHTRCRRGKTPELSPTSVQHCFWTYIFPQTKTTPHEMRSAIETMVVACGSTSVSGY